MDTAIDFYARGKEKEVRANKYNIHSYYPRGKFICPECGEEVYLTHSKYKNYFAHYKKTEKTIECDRRVDAVSYESIYERIGLPMYIKESSLGRFELFISFRSLPSSIMEKVDLTTIIMEINGKSKYRVSSERFSVNHSTWIPIEHIDPEYRISYSGEKKIISSLYDTWGGFAEGFVNYGSLFAFDGNGGRKIHRGDSIALDTEYLWLLSNYKRFPISSDLGVEKSKIGSILLGDQSFSVFKILIDSRVSDHGFKWISSFLLRTFNIHLLEKVPQLTPIWPPVVKRKEGYLYEKKHSKGVLFGHIDSGNMDPSVYQYLGNHSDPIVVNTIQDKVARIRLATEKVFINIDRKYVSGGMYLEAGVVDYLNGSATEAVLLNDESEDISCSIVGLSSGKIKIESDSEIDVIHISPYSIGILATGIREFSVIIQHGETLILLQNNIVKALLCYPRGEIDKHKSMGPIRDLMLKYPYSYKVKIPEKIRISLKQLGDEYPEIQKIISEGYISIPLLRYLEEQNHA